MPIPKNLSSTNKFTDELIDEGVKFHANHPKYNEWVLDALEEINSNVGNNELLSAMEELASFLRNEVTVAYNTGSQINVHFSNFIKSRKFYRLLS